VIVSSNDILYRERNTKVEREERQREEIGGETEGERQRRW
jgi:hypothetical protein